MMRTLIRTLLAAAFVVGTAQSALANEGAELQKPGFSFDGVFGRYDPAALKRGYTVFHDVCAGCHGLRLVAFRNLADVGLTKDEIKAAAAEQQIMDGPNDEGQMAPRPGLPSDRMAILPSTAKTMAASLGAVPPDLSLITKARKGGPDYVYSLLLGYEDKVPADVPPLPEGKLYNKVFPYPHAISMPPPLSGEPEAQKQAAHDVVTFLAWAAEPELNARKALGLWVMGFLLVLTILFYALKVQIWRDVH